MPKKMINQEGKHVKKILLFYNKYSSENVIYSKIKLLLNAINGALSLELHPKK